MNEKELIILKNNLVNSQEWEQIRELQLNKIVELSTSNIEPLVIVGMLRNIANTDKWAKEYISRKEKETAKKE